MLGSQLSVVQYDPIVIAIVGSRSGCSCCGVLVMVTKILMEDVLTLLMLIKDCGNKKNKYVTVTVIVTVTEVIDAMDV